MSDETQMEEETLEEETETSEKKKRKKDRILELENKCEELNEKYLYALAQMRDLHKTYEKENAIALKYVTYDLMTELLPIIDIFTMVLENSNVPDEVRAYFKGFELVYNQFKQVMENHGVSEIATKLGDKFDHNIHNGVEKVDTSENEDDTIAEVLQRGYRIGDKILRPVSVKVFSNPKKEVEKTVVEQEENATINEEDKGE